jgi:hypothetical protein
MQQDSSSDPTVTVPARPRWLFRGRPGAWDAFVAALTEDPSHPARWPIAPSGPAIDVGDAILLWRSGRGGGIAALCTVVEEPEAVLRPGVAPEVVVGVRIDRALSVPIAPATLVRDPVLRPLAFMDLLDESERRVNPAQEQALAALLERRDRPDASRDPDAVASEARTAVQVPVRLLPIVEELLVALGADDPAPAPSHPVRRAVAGATPPEQASEHETNDPTDLQLDQAAEVARAHGDAPFTVDDVAKVWRTGVGTARSRIDRLIDSGLLERAGTLRSDDRPGERPVRGRPPVLYRLARPAGPHQS